MEQQEKKGCSERLEQAAAGDVCHGLLAMARLMDRLAKEDDHTGLDMLGVLRGALLEVPGHPWYARRAHLLGPIVRACIAEWFVKLEIHPGKDAPLPCLERSLADTLERCLGR